MLQQGGVLQTTQQTNSGWLDARVVQESPEQRNFPTALVTGLGVRVMTGLGARDVTGLGVRDVTGLGARDVTGLGVRVMTGLGPRVMTGLGPRVIQESPEQRNLPTALVIGQTQSELSTDFSFQNTM